MVFKAKNAHTWKVRVDHPDGRYATLTTGCRNKADADDVERWVRKWEGRRGKKLERLDVIDALIEKRIYLPDAVAAAEEGTLEQLLAAHAPPAPERDLVPLIAAAVQEKQASKKGAGMAAEYERMLGVLFPERPLYLSAFTRKAARDRLAALSVDAPSKNRYRSAVSFLAKYLVSVELLETNFVRDIPGFGENDPRMVYYEIADAERLIRHLEQPYAAISAAALAFCMERVALQTWLTDDVDFTADPVVAHVRGTKRGWRDRYVPMVPELTWTLDYIRPAFANKLRDVRVFDAVPWWNVIETIQATATRLEIRAVGEDQWGAHDLHDWRRTHGVALSRWGYHEQIIADHEGHKNTTLVRENYARFRSSKHDYAKRAPIALVKEREEGNG